MPQAEAALSPAPPATGMPARRPHFDARSARSAARRFGALDQRRHLALAEIGRGQQLVRPAPLRRRRARRCRPSPTFPTCARRSARGAENPWAAAPWRRGRRSPARCSCTQASFGAVKPGKDDVAGDLAERGSASSAAASLWLRVSFHRMQGRSTRRGRRPASRHACGRTGRCPRRPRVRFGRAALQPVDAPWRWRRSSRSGSCSDQPGCGRETSSGAVAEPTTRWSASISSALTLDVPRSMPEIHEPSSRWRRLTLGAAQTCVRHRR